MGFPQDDGQMITSEASRAFIVARKDTMTMTDLIWVGNTLYPRWFVFAVPIAIVIVPYLIAGIEDKTATARK